MSDGCVRCVFYFFFFFLFFTSVAEEGRLHSAMLYWIFFCFSESGYKVTASASNKLDNDGYCNDASWTQQFRTTFSFSTSTSTVDRSLQQIHTAISERLFLSLFLCPYVYVFYLIICSLASVSPDVNVFVRAKEKYTTDHTPLSLFDICFVAWSYVMIAWASSAGTHLDTHTYTQTCTNLYCSTAVVYVRCINSIVHFVS